MCVYRQRCECTVYAYEQVCMYIFLYAHVYLQLCTCIHNVLAFEYDKGCPDVYFGGSYKTVQARVNSMQFIDFS